MMVRDDYCRGAENSKYSRYQLSIVIPAFNVETYIGQCLESLAAELRSDDPVEVLLVDDGSTDETASRMDAFANSHSELAIKLVTQSNRGVGAARQTGVNLASSPWIMFLDSDDVFVRGGITSVLDAVVRHAHHDVIGFAWKSFDDVSGRFVPGIGFHPSESEALCWPHQPWAKAFRVDLLKREQFPSMAYEDLAYIPAILWLASSVVSESSVVMAYRKNRAAAATSDVNPAKLVEIIAAVDYALDICRRHSSSATALSDAKVRRFRTDKIVVDGFLDKVPKLESIGQVYDFNRILRRHLRSCDLDYEIVRARKGLLAALVVAAAMHAEPGIATLSYRLLGRLKRYAFAR
ncbi:glycosyltransferase family 2 protein [Salinisphaera hydrothermalis]|uniref:glycosyltransferase family 2 protein n=1 Tax=Salinisphaera hydrothermalis TaxID=563188 RepID=UPI0033427638